MMVRLRPEKKTRPRKHWMTGDMEQAKKWAEKGEEPTPYTLEELDNRGLCLNGLGILVHEDSLRSPQPLFVYPDDHLMGVKRVYPPIDQEILEDDGAERGVEKIGEVESAEEESAEEDSAEEESGEEESGEEIGEEESEEEIEEEESEEGGEESENERAKRRRIS